MSKQRAVNVKVHIRETKGDITRLIKKFMKKVKKERVLDDYLDRRFFEKPSSKRRKERIKKKRNAQKAQQERNKKLDIK